ncbi:hypothetical protein [Streptosporangium sp. OZ121]|uniref:hypothetical protein n=1 Tax=Streptosporangium sp. OZ121 TaxID=3444183 RepID=UPI003F79D2F2
MPRARWTDEQLQGIRESYPTEEPVEAIAARLNMKVEAVVNAARTLGVRRPTGLKPSRTKWLLTEDQKRDLLAAYGTDEPVAEIAARLGVPDYVVRTHAQEAGVRRPASAPSD